MVEAFNRSLAPGDLIVYTKTVTKGNTRDIPSYALVLSDNSMYIEGTVKKNQSGRVLLVELPTEEELVIQAKLVSSWMEYSSVDRNYAVGSVFEYGIYDSYTCIYLGSPVVYFCDSEGKSVEVSRTKLNKNTFLAVRYMDDKRTLERILSGVKTNYSFVDLLSAARKKPNQAEAIGWKGFFFRKKDFTDMGKVIGAVDLTKCMVDGKIVVDLSYENRSGKHNMSYLVLDYTGRN